MKTHDDRTTRFGAVEGLSPGQRLASGPGLCSRPSPARPSLRLPRHVGSLGTERCLRQRPLLSANLAGGGPTV